MNFLLFFAPAVIATLIMSLAHKKEITFKESMISLGANFVVALFFVACVAGYGYSKTYDTQLLSGQVVSKSRDKVSCSHSYQCNPRKKCSGSGKDRRCWTEYDTCYDHSYDVDWNVKTTLSNYTISRVDRRGLEEPKRWSIVEPGEYVVSSSMYRNYLLIDENSLFVELKSTAKADHLIPEYPEVYDYWKVGRTLGQMSPKTREEIDNVLNTSLKVLGPSLQLNIVVVATKQNKEYFNTLMAKWRGGKKNDVILVYGVDDNENVVWFNSNSYAMGMGNKELHTRLLLNAHNNVKLSSEHVQTQVDLINKHFVRLSAKEFEFKLNNLEPPISVVFFMVIVSLCVSFGVGRFMAKNNF